MSFSQRRQGDVLPLVCSLWKNLQALGKGVQMSGVNFVEACAVGICFEIWCYTFPNDLREPIWRMAFVALAWSI